jgi:cobalt-zinc-cadmium resistance protein CzcA
MLTRILEFSLANRLLVLAATALVAGAGVWSAYRLPIDAVPDLTNNQVQINANCPGLSAFESERLITRPVETAMAGLPGVVEVRSLSAFGLSQVTVIFEDDVDVHLARQLVQERLQIAAAEIPEGVGKPEMAPISTGLGEIFQYSLESDVRDLTELRTLQDWVVKPQLRTVPGVAEINSFGGFDKQFEILVRPDDLLKHGLDIHGVHEAVAAGNFNVGGGYVVKAGEQLVVRGVGQIQTAEQILGIVVGSDRGVPVRVGDVADVGIGGVIRQGAVTRDGKGERVVGIVMMLRGANSRTVSTAVRERLDEIRKTLPADVRVDVFYDRTELVDRTIRTAAHNLLEGAILVVAVLFVMLGNIRAAVITALAIPVSMLFAVGLMLKAGIAGSLMSLGAIDFGLVVDGSVILVENVIRRGSHPVGADAGISRLELIRRASAEVLKPALSGVLIIVVVYLPILALEGVEGKLFRPMAMTVIFALAGSMFVSLTLMPVLASFALTGRLSERETFPVRWARAAYRPLLDGCLGNPVPALTAAVVSVAAAAATLPMLGSEFIPRLDEGSLAIELGRLPSVSLDESIRHATLLEKTLLEGFPDEVAAVVSKTGRPEIATDPMGVHRADVMIMLHPPERWTKAATKAELEEKMRAAVKALPGMSFGWSQPIELRVNELVAGVRSDIGIKIIGDDLDTLKRLGDRTVAAVARIPGAEGFKAQQVAGMGILQVAVDPDRASRYGLRTAEILQVVQAMAGIDAGQVHEGQRRFPMVVRLPERFRRDREALAAFPLTAPGGERVPLSAVADITETDGPAEISRENAARLIIVEGNVRGRDIGGFVAELRELFDSGAVRLPEGYRVEFGGQFENLERARTRLMIVVPVALALIFLLLYTTFGSLGQAALVFTGIPLATVGGVFALMLRDMPFSISAGVGFIALFGVAVLNGVVMVSHINRLRGEGVPLRRAVRDGALDRLRPVLMTALAAGLGFVPMAISQGAGAEVQRPLATAVIGGLASSTLLTLLVLPVLYNLLERGRTAAGAAPDGAPAVSEASSPP